MNTFCKIAALTAAAASAAGELVNAASSSGRALRNVSLRTTYATNITQLSTDGEKHCTDQINKWRKSINEDALDYNAASGFTPSTELATFLAATSCDALASGKFNHLQEDDSDGKVFVISATKTEATRTDITCQDAIDQWETGFSAFKGEYPPQYTDGEGAYLDPNAAALVSLLSSKAQTIFCGVPDSCGNSTVVCYMKPSGITENEYPVEAPMWHQVEQFYKMKPALADQKEESSTILSAVNALRKAAGIENDYTFPSEAARSRAPRAASATTFENVLYNLTCQDIEDLTIDPLAADGYTLIYALKDGGEAPSPAEAITFWETGFEKMGTDMPPVFKAKAAPEESDKDAEEASASAAEAPHISIYYDNAVAGYVSIMTEKARELTCYNATGCSKGAFICFVKEPTLVNGQKPISNETWGKILSSKGITKPTLTIRKEQNSCIDEMNAVRTQESLGLSAFVTSEGTKEQTTALSDLLLSITCAGLEGGSPTVVSADGETSLMYYYGAGDTCYEAVNEWKLGYSQFTGVNVPPPYSSTAEIYKLGEAVNFVSLVSEGNSTVATCYTASGCAEKGIVCELSPAALKEGKEPVSAAVWAKVSETMTSNGVASISVLGALLSSAALAVTAFAFAL